MYMGTLGQDTCECIDGTVRRLQYSPAGVLQGSQTEGGRRPQSGRGTSEARSENAAVTADSIVAEQAADKTSQELTQQGLYAVAGYQLITALLSLHCSTRSSNHLLESSGRDNKCLLE